jgi:osomolarity two-component system, response regulator SSK1
MGDSKLTRLRAKLLRRSSTSSAKAASSTFKTDDTSDIDGLPNASNVSLSLNTEERQRKTSDAPKLQMSKTQSAPLPTTRRHPSSIKIPAEKSEAINTETSPAPPSPISPFTDAPPPLRCPKVTLEQPTPEVLSREGTSDNIKEVLAEQSSEANAEETIPTSPGNPPSSSSRPNIAQRRQSLVPYSQTRLIKTLLESERPPTSRSAHGDYFSGALPSIQANMISRKIWVKRPGASATLVTIHEDDVVDDVRDAILRKYTNSLGRSFDAPDVTLKIVSRDHSHSNRSSSAERVLGPEEPIGRTLDAYFPGGQTVEEALIIDVPQRRTPKPSPRQGHHMPQYYYAEHIAPGEGGEYFPPMPAVPSPHFPPQLTSVSSGQGPPHHPSIHSMSVLTTGQIPPLPSPGTRGPRHQRRPNNARQHTSSPTILTSNSPSTTSGNKYPPDMFSRP